MLVLSLACLTCLVPGEAGLLGAGRGDGSCAAPPFRADTADLAWPGGCPAWAPCCTEYGYCHPRAGWEQELFRDCNGESNGIPLPPDTLQAEAEAAGKLPVELLCQLRTVLRSWWRLQLRLHLCLFWTTW